MDRVELGLDVTCPNCKQAVKLVPRSRSARGWRNVARMLIVIGGVWLFFTLYSCREREIVRTLGGVPLPDISRAHSK